jgi:DNA-directed RNA polymerase subunit RPC12/RpoP
VETFATTSTNNEIVDSYLKKHNLNVKILPNRKVVKLSDIMMPSLESENPIPVTTPVKDESTTQEMQIHQKKQRKKREPSLKLQQKLKNDDLELIVNSLKEGKASVHIADINKDTYIDKILKVQLQPTTTLTFSNGKTDALLKKSMFPKELSNLFDNFVASLCKEETYTDSTNDLKKLKLKCQVVDCHFDSCSEAEMYRHIKRHLAQDGYTCHHCQHQFASMTNLQRHVKMHDSEMNKELKCPHCDYKTNTSTHIKRHMAHKHLERSLPCPHCTFMGATNAEIKIHMARKHLELTGKNPLFLPKYLRKNYQCNICKQQYNDFKAYQKHTYEHSGTLNRFQCKLCPYNCKNYSKLNVNDFFGFIKF